MRYLSFAGLVMLAAASTAIACSDDDTVSPGSAEAGEAGAVSQAGSSGKAGASGIAGTSGEGGAATGGSGAEAGVEAGAAGVAGEPSGGTSGGGTGGTSGGGTGGTTIGGTGGTSGGGTGGTTIGGTGGTGGVATALSVTISGVPTGSTAAVTVAGPASYSQTVAATTTLSSLTAGSYTIAAPAIRVAGTQVDTVYDPAVTGSPATVASGTTSNATVAYARRPGTGMMWVTNASGKNAFGFDAAALAKTGTQSDAAGVGLTFNLTGNLFTQAIAFSSTGDLWLSTCKTQAPQVLAKYAPSKLSASGSPTADVTITLPGTDSSYGCSDALAFDAAGNLWVGYQGGHILKYNASDLTATGTPAPAVNLTSSYFTYLVDMAFDSAGNLLVAAYGFAGIPRLSPAQLTTSDSAVVPAVILTMPGAAPGGLTLASDGSLWVADYNTGGTNSRLLKFNSTDLGATGTPTPAVTITGVDGPEQLAFDKAGNLWVTSFDDGIVAELAAASLTTSGAKTALATLSNGGNFTNTYGLRFDPSAF